MKKVIWMIALVVLALAALGVGVALAQAPQPPGSGYGPNGAGDGPLHDYMISAMADAVGLSSNEFELRHDAGERFYEIALAQGYASEEIPSLMQAARAQALEAAVKDGVITQEQADWMAGRGFGNGGMMGGFGRGNRSGDCPMFDADGTGSGSFGPGRMGGGRWQ